MKVLLVDDSKMMRGILKKILTELGGVEFVEAGDGVQAMEVLAATSGGFQLILIDWNMPNMDGITLVGKIRTTDKATPLIMVTTEAEKTRIMEAIKAGVNNYVLKPFTPESLMEKVKLTLKIAA
jgi:two-component system chemotaxis response regulator CheY